MEGLGLKKDEGASAQSYLFSDAALFTGSTRTLFGAQCSTMIHWAELELLIIKNYCNDSKRQKEQIRKEVGG